MDPIRENPLVDSISPSRPRDQADVVAPASSAAASSDGSPTEVLEIFWRGRWIVLAAVLIALTAAVIFLKRATPLYASTSQIYVEKTGPKIITENLTQNGSQDGFYLQTQCEIIKSPAILSIAVEKGNLRALKTFEGADNPVAAVRAGLNAELGKMNDIITVSFESPSPEDSAQTVNAVVEAYKTYNDTQQRSTASEVLRILEREYKDREMERDQKMKKMVEFRQANSGVEFDPDNKSGIDNQQLTALTQALVVAQMAEADAKAGLELAREAVVDPRKLRELLLAERDLRDGNANLTDLQNFNPQEAQLITQLSDLQSQREDLSSRFLPNHPDIKFLDAKIARVKEQLGGIDSGAAGASATHMTDAQKHFAQAYLSSAQEKLKIAQIKVKSVEESFGRSLKSQQDRAIDSNNKAATYALLTADFHRAEQLCDQLDSRMKDIHVGEDAGSMNVSILEVARASMVPSKPLWTRTLGIALVVGLMVGLGLAFLNGWMDQRFRSAEDVSASLSLPILGAVPQILGREPISARGQKAHLQPISDFAEACRAIRTAIYFGMPDSQAKTLLVTSPLPGDGKSTAASNLAIVMAQAGQKTVILDADFRRPNQHRIFSLDQKQGASSVLANKVSLDEAIKPSGIKGVDVLPCGPTPSHPAELLNSQAFADLLQELSRRYDHVVVDSPPVMPVTDARILGAICDATVFVVRAEKSTRKVSVFARDVLQSVGTNILGVMINGLSRGRGYYDAGYYQYGYGGSKRPASPADNASRSTAPAVAGAVSIHPAGGAESDPS